MESQFDLRTQRDTLEPHYQQGEPNFRVIQQWNAAGVNQTAIAIMGARIDRWPFQL